jgi:hypothetical protein
MVLHVVYRNATYDYVNSRYLDELIEKSKVRAFFRPSERKWVNVDLEPIRMIGIRIYYNGIEYDGIERRNTDNGL